MQVGVFLKDTSTSSMGILRIKLASSLYRCLSTTRPPWHTSFLIFTHPPLPSLPLCPCLHISTKSDPISEQLKTPWTSKCQSQGLLFFFQKTGQGSRHCLKLACAGTCWPTLAREWYRLNGCQVIEDCQSNFKWPLSPSLLRFRSPLLSLFTLLLPLSVSLSLTLSFSLCLCLYLRLRVC